MNTKNIKKILFRFIFAGVLTSICLAGLAVPHSTDADYIVQEASKTIKVVITAYSSTPDQTDDTPFITASGKRVKDGIIASNMLPFGTKVKIPNIYGDKIFTVQDRMNRRKSNYQIDIWMPDRDSALKFGVKTAEMQILED